MELQEKKKNRTEQKTDMQNKEKALLTQLDEIAKQDLCLAFSGGVDSSLLLKLVMDASAKYSTGHFRCNDAKDGRLGSMP